MKNPYSSYLSAILPVCPVENLFLEEVEQLSRKPKPIVVLFILTWCKYCKMMENTTFKKPRVY
jgi:thiol:disulfide interchange protein